MESIAIWGWLEHRVRAEKFTVTLEGCQLYLCSLCREMLPGVSVHPPCSLGNENYCSRDIFCVCPNYGPGVLVIPSRDKNDPVWTNLCHTSDTPQ